VGVFFSSHFVESFKVLSVLFFGIVVLKIMASIFNVQSIEILNGNNLHTWKMKMEFFMHEKGLWEIIGTKKIIATKS
jgi:hypothetical protein